MQLVTESVSNDLSNQPIKAEDLSRQIKARALAEGFDKIGIVPALPFETERQNLLQWLGRGFHGEMKWMARDPDQRTDPRKFFPEAQSALVVALNYYTAQKHQESSTTGKVSRYAWGDDYHEVVKSKLGALLSWLRERIPGVKGKICVDTQPMMDKAWAVRAGLGWIGKHSNLITPELGSWVFIGELLLNLELDYDNQLVEDHCGSCTLCLDACPTKAITEPYVVDSNKCISYATIELRAEQIPTELASNLEGWLYGCDICQNVCPWNRFEQPTNIDAFSPRTENINADLQNILELTPELYSERFQHSPMKRAKLHGLQRNARTLLEASPDYSRRVALRARPSGFS